jgi:hypothetical protein
MSWEQSRIAEICFALARKHHETSRDAVRTAQIVQPNLDSLAASMEAQQMTKDFVAIGAGMLVVGLGICALWGDPQNGRPAETQEARILADDPALKLVSEQNPYMRTER